METAIKKAIEEGYYVKPLLGTRGKQRVESGKIVTVAKKSADGWESTEYERLEDVNIHKLLLDPLFWQCLGKALGWNDYSERRKMWAPESTSHLLEDGWKHQWHRFIDHLAEGKHAESFFSNLVK